MEGFYWILGISGFIGSAQSCQALRSATLLPPLDIDDALEEPRSKISVVIAVRDEVRRIEGTLRRLFQQRHVDFEIIVVDDRSSDGTTEILKNLELEDSRLRVIRIDTLPAGWLGKCHACHIGALQAQGEWI